MIPASFSVRRYGAVLPLAGDSGPTLPPGLIFFRNGWLVKHVHLANEDIQALCGVEWEYGAHCYPQFFGVGDEITICADCRSRL